MANQTTALQVLAGVALMVASGNAVSGGAIDWRYTPDYQLSIERCMARETGMQYGFLADSRNCMNHNGFMPILKDGVLTGWQGAGGTFPKATAVEVKP